MTDADRRPAPEAPTRFSILANLVPAGHLLLTAIAVLALADGTAARLGLGLASLYLAPPLAVRAAFAATYPRAHATDALSPVAVVLTAAMHATCRALTAREGTDLDLMAALTHPITLNALALHARVFDAAGKDAAPKDAAR